MVKSQNLDIVSSWNSMLVLLHGITGVRPFFQSYWWPIVRSHLCVNHQGMCTVNGWTLEDSSPADQALEGQSLRGL